MLAAGLFEDGHGGVDRRARRDGELEGVADFEVLLREFGGTTAAGVLGGRVNSAVGFENRLHQEFI